MALADFVETFFKVKITQVLVGSTFVVTKVVIVAAIF
jgi:hypothetical protein